MIRRPLLLLLLLATWALSPVFAVDPPHQFSALPADPCESCHVVHTSPGGALTTVDGNANLCLSCHVTGGAAAAFPFDAADQALPSPGLPAGVTPSGTSHRWDSGPSGWVAPDVGNTSPGTVQSTGAFTGAYAKTYTITIVTGGDVGMARFDWTGSAPGGGGGSNVLTGTGVPLDEGISVDFADGAASPAFVNGDVWRLYVRTDLNLPTTAQMLARLEDGRVMCSTCHDQHNQSKTPFDPGAPAYAGAGTGSGRHFQRVDNGANEMCVDCHSARDVTDAAQGSHPVGTSIPGGEYQDPRPTLPLDGSDNVVCMSCHELHDPDGSKGLPNDGTLVRTGNAPRPSDTQALCASCHTLADTATPGSHQNTAAAETLWPGPQYGTTFPQVTDTARQGWCTNCHQPHGWPDTASPTQDYPSLLVELEESLCYTCHDGAPVAPSLMAEFSKASNHPLGLSSTAHGVGEAALVNSPNRHVECMDCHNTHQAKPRVDLPGPSTSPRPASGPLAEVVGIDLAGAAIDPAAFEYQLCFRCHADSTGKPSPPTPRQFPSTNVRLEFDGSMDSFHGVAVTGTLNPRLPSLEAGWAANSLMACTGCHNNNAGPANGGAGPNGPHGSTRPNLLERRYETADNTTYAEAKYALCFKCHAPEDGANNGILDDRSFDKHDKHIRGEDTPCNVCHDPHASGSQKKLINFDTSVVSPWNSQLEFIAPEDAGDGKGKCFLTCHGENHDPFDYTPN
ncbi:MAG: cytochrome c3 family protein [Thermoanaerobaculia bacterium]